MRILIVCVLLCLSPEQLGIYKLFSNYYLVSDDNPKYVTVVYTYVLFLFISIKKFLSTADRAGFGSPGTPQMNLTANPGSSVPTFPVIQRKGCEVIAHFLGTRDEDGDRPVRFTLGQ